jgi:Fe-S-cluster-containing dehydrogenase component/DMSO reductase anchor subunit
MNFDGSGGSATVLDRGIASWRFQPDATLIGSFLDEQGDLSAVERFVQFHADVDRPLQGRYYSALMPARAPGPGEQLAFEVDLDRCSGCKACVAACHNMNGLDEGESWRDVGLLIGHKAELPVIQHVTSACHHCLDPACSSACPVDAYEKDPLTGIVRHLDDQCFGCGYCSLACPYDIPKFHAAKGIVRKCDMCWDRLRVGEAPACVQACPHEAIRIHIVDNAEVIARAEAGKFLPAAPCPSYTAPTTRYRSTHVIAPGGARAADDHQIDPEHAHWPLVVMLVLTQLSLGGYAAVLVAELAGATVGIGNGTVALWSLFAGWAGILASLFHLGRPGYAYRALIGIRHSWLSREVLAFGLFVALASLYVTLLLLWPDWLGVRSGIRQSLLALVVATGSAGVACSVMVYHVVRRPYWHAAYVGPRFASTAVVLGLALVLAGLGLGSLNETVASSGASLEWPLVVVTLSLTAATAGKLRFEATLRRHFDRSELPPLQKTAFLLAGPLRRPARLRRLLGVVGGVALPVLAALGAAARSPSIVAPAAALALAALVCGEMAERYLFFSAVVRPKMPGGLMP